MAAPLAWYLMAERSAPERSIWRTSARAVHLKKQNGARKLAGRVIDVEDIDERASYTIDVGEDAPVVLRGARGLAKKDDDVKVTTDIARTEIASADCRTAPEIREERVAKSTHVIAPWGEPDENHVLAMWWSRCFVISPLAIPLAIAVLVLR